nr:LysM-like peptidoglycan-binding domain-containing protein [Winslowiella arboricola]
MMPEGSSSRSKLKVSNIWRFVDNARWMDPLPARHRRGIIVALLVMLLAFLWPNPQPDLPQAPPAQQSGAGDTPLQAEVYNNNESSPPAAVTETPPKADSQGEWRNYQVASGQTMAQLFRDNNLQVNDVFAMARVEGDDKPLSNLHTGQKVKIRQDANGVVTGLTVETDNGAILFTRQPDGTFIRAQ